MIKMYGVKMSRAGRTLWALEEMGLPYEQVPIRPREDTRKSDFLKINPNGHVPVIDDNGLVLYESMAINLYLAEKYGRAPLWPASIEDRARAYQWGFWGMTEVEPPLVTALRHMVLFPPEMRDANLAKQSVESLKPPFTVLDEYLKGRSYLLGKDFTVADLSLAGILSFTKMADVGAAAYGNIEAWLGRCLSRPANQRAQQKQ
ncbi:MAG: glutathione S-transferase family protein [Candidatus Binataceae bacterium]|nr:glutathione S-transferase family protein [Candidatus Binataceae bacterium]